MAARLCSSVRRLSSRSLRSTASASVIFWLRAAASISSQDKNDTAHSSIPSGSSTFRQVTLSRPGITASCCSSVWGDVGVAFQHHDRVAAHRRPEHLHGRNVDASQRQRHGHLSDAAGGVLVVDDQGVAVAAEVGGTPSISVTRMRAAAHRRGLERQLPGRCGR